MGIFIKLWFSHLWGFSWNFLSIENMKNVFFRVDRACNMIHNLKHQSTPPPHTKKVKNAILRSPSEIPCWTYTKSFACRDPRIWGNNCLLNFKTTAAVIELILPTPTNTQKQKALGKWNISLLDVLQVQFRQNLHENIRLWSLLWTKEHSDWICIDINNHCDESLLSNL